jgi:hypothetical protein
MRIINIGQVVNVEHGAEIIHQITVEVPSGKRVQVYTDENTAKQLLDALLDSEPTKPVHTQKTLNELLASDIALDEEELAEEAYAGDFFGGVDPGELNANRDVVMGALSEVPVVEDAPRGGLGQFKKHESKTPRRPTFVDSDGFLLPIKAKTVPKDEMGYPIVQRREVIPSVPDDDGDGDGTQI